MKSFTFLFVISTAIHNVVTTLRAKLVQLSSCLLSEQRFRGEEAVPLDKIGGGVCAVDTVLFGVKEPTTIV